MAMIIKRDYYLQQLISSKSNNLIKIVTGIRRSGKSFLLFNLFHNHLIETGVSEDHIIEIALTRTCVTLMLFFNIFMNVL